MFYEPKSTYSPNIHMVEDSIQPRFVIVLLAFGGHGYNPSQAPISSIRFGFELSCNDDK
jgi:hypothetical protein